MRVAFDKTGELWHGFHYWRSHRWYDLGLIAIDYYGPDGADDTGARLVIYFWKFTIEIF
jgi:hypothetical protein